MNTWSGVNFFFWEVNLRGSATTFGGTDVVFSAWKQAQLFPKTSWDQPGKVESQNEVTVLFSTL